ncbi:hypothetical protein PK98_00040 [Croceibacterium mercuriale]|uniref:Oligosaccharide repeat unit polymerase n=2 Tax=Croceibacterium mercuriale TaxID=1572751 RepID=A0A0B2BUG0_9SPHN|nr:hypothetical protein PK98_00040 [Croceibacterium mercuriale]
MYAFWLTVSVATVLVVTLVFSRHRAFNLFHPLAFYLMFHAIVFVIRPIFSVLYDFHGLYDAIGFWPNDWERSQVLICTNLGLVAFAACSLSVGKEAVRFSTTDDGAFRLALLKVYWLPAIIIGALGLWSVIWLWSVADDFGQFTVRNGGTGEGGLRGVSGYFLSMQTMLGILGAVLAWLGRFRLWSLAPIALFTLLQFGAGGRGQAVSGLTALALLYLFGRRKTWPNASIVTLFLVAAVVFNTVQADRGRGIRSLLGFETEVVVKATTTTGPKPKPLETMDLANMEFFEYLVWAIPKRTGSYDYFLSNLQIFTEPVPRALWPGKPYGPPIKMFELFRYGKALGATSSVPGAGWIQWGYAGVFIWSSLFGLFYGWIYKVFTRHHRNALVAVAYMVFLSASPVAFRDGAIVSIAKQMIFFMVPVLALWFSANVILEKRSFSAAGGSGSTVSPFERRRGLAAGDPRLRPASWSAGSENDLAPEAMAHTLSGRVEPRVPSLGSAAGGAEMTADKPFTRSQLRRRIRAADYG